MLIRRREFLRVAGGGLVAGSALGGGPVQAERDVPRPNILWITCEDIGPHLGCYGYAEAATPNLDRLSGEGLRYENAFSVAGVCAPSRSCLITGMYPTSLGTCHMRCNNPPPEDIKCFPEYLRNAGYYCTNNSKTDYNFPPPKSAWDESSREAHWRSRPDPDQPFFAVFNFTTTHESRIGTLPEKMGENERKLLPNPPHDPANAEVPPYYPNTPVIRRHWAHYFDLITAMDRQAGAILDQLEEDGLADNTIVFFYSDHGAGMPFAKRWMYDRGLHVPLIIRWPGTLTPNTTTDRLVSFVDFAPTVLSLAGVDVPAHMQGVPFLGAQEGAPREYIFAARDRMDETYDMIRAARDKRYKYIRNYEPERPYDQFLTYPEGFGMLQEMRRVEKAGELKGAEKLFFRDRKPVEELYDTEQDPHEITNLTEVPEYSQTLTRLREAMDAWMETVNDLGCIPEFALADWLAARDHDSVEWPHASYPRLTDDAGNAAVFGTSANTFLDHLNGTNRLARLWAIKSLGIIGPPVEVMVREAARDPDVAVAYWAALALGNHGPLSPETQEVLQSVMSDGPVPVRLAAARSLYPSVGKEDVLPAILDAARDENPWVRLLAVQVLDDMKETSGPAHDALTQAKDDENQYVGRVAEHALTS